MKERSIIYKVNKLQMIRLLFQQKSSEMKWNYHKTSRNFSNVHPLNSYEISELLNTLKQNEQQTVLQNLINTEESSNSYEIDYEYETLNHLFLSNHYKLEYESKLLEDLIQLGQQRLITYADEDRILIENITKKQAKSKEWKMLRVGRITASNFKAVCRTNVAHPSISLIKRICYPDEIAFSVPATRYGCTHETKAIKDFKLFMAKTHISPKITSTGLLVNNDYPHLGATPDGMCSCECCGDSVIEIKCPYCLKDGYSISSYLKRRDCPIEKKNFDYILKEDHQYYYQVQMQMFVSQRKKAFFVIYTKHKLLVVAVDEDVKFWKKEYPKTIFFFKSVIMPEILGRYFTNKKSVLSELNY